MKKLLLIIICVVLLVGCNKSGTPVKTMGSKSDFEVQRLFKVDGITIYRFWDNGDPVYFTSKGDVIQNEHQTIYVSSRKMR